MTVYIIATTLSVFCLIACLVFFFAYCKAKKELATAIKNEGIIDGYYHDCQIHRINICFLMGVFFGVATIFFSLIVWYNLYFI